MATKKDEKDAPREQDVEPEREQDAEPRDLGSDPPYQDVSAQVEEAQEEAQKPVEYDDEGNPIASDSTAAAEVEAEMAHRSSGAAEGGGPWPPELMAERYVVR